MGLRLSRRACSGVFCRVPPLPASSDCFCNVWAVAQVRQQVSDATLMVSTARGWSACVVSVPDSTENYACGPELTKCGLSQCVDVLAPGFSLSMLVQSAS